MNSSKFLFIMTFLMAVIIVVSTSSADNWSQWRGPSLNGYTSEKDLPESWSKTDNVIWVANMSGPGPATPVIWENKVFVTAAEKGSHTLWAICLDRSNGQELWKYEAGVGFRSRNGNNGASCSPITDGESVYFLFGTGDMMAFDMDGGLIWRRNIQEDHGRFNVLFGYGASPLLYDGKLYLSVLHRHTRAEVENPMSYLLCIDPKTGKDLWKHERKTDAEGESMEAYTTPYPFEEPDGVRIIVSGADYVTAHDPEDGREVWRSLNLNPHNRKNYRLVPTNVSISETLIFYEPRGRAIFAMKGGKSGQLSEDDLIWTVQENAPDVCSPLVMDGKLYVLDGNRKVVSCLDPETGEALWREKLAVDGRFQSSPTGADGKIYCISMDGEVVVLSASDTPGVISTIDMGEGECRSTIAAAHGQLFIRTAENLYCIGE